MANLILRTLTNPGDTTKGSRLTAEELDQNQINLKLNDRIGYDARRRFGGGTISISVTNDGWPVDSIPFYEAFWVSPDATKALVLVQDNNLASSSRQNTIVVLDVVEDGDGFIVKDAVYPIASNANRVTLSAPYSTRADAMVYSCFFNDTGTKFYVLVDSGDVIYYSVATPYNLSTASFVSATPNVAYGYYGMVACTDNFLACTNSAMTQIYIYRMTDGNPSTINFSKYGLVTFNDSISYVSLDCPFLHFTQPTANLFKAKVAIYDTVLGYPIVYELVYDWTDDTTNSVTIDLHSGESWGGCPSWWVESKKILFDFNSHLALYSDGGGLAPDLIPGQPWNPVAANTSKTLSLNPFTANVEQAMNAAINSYVAPHVHDYDVVIPQIGSYRNMPPNTTYPAGYLYYSYITSTGLKFFRPTTNSENLTGFIVFKVNTKLASSYFYRSDRFSYTYVMP